MGDIRKKFLDILFEPDSEEIEAEAPLSEIKEEAVKVENSVIENVKNIETIKSPNVKDVLYGKQEKPSSFIDYFEVPKTEKPVERDSETYEMRENVSPIFGPVVQKERKKKSINDKEVQKAVSSINSNDFNGIVISPIYGYDDNKANEARKVLSDSKPKKEKVNVEEISFEEIEVPFEVPEDMSETIKEAVQEAVVELTPFKAVSEKEKVVEENETIQEEQMTLEEAEDNNVSDETYEDELEKEYEEVVEEYSFDEPVIDGEEEEVVSFEEPFDDTEEFEAIEENLIEETSELSNEDLENIKKANRSIYDTTPIELFDLDDITEKDNKEKDLFDELIGDDD